MKPVKKLLIHLTFLFLRTIANLAMKQTLLSTILGVLLVFTIDLLVLYKLYGSLMSVN